MHFWIDKRSQTCGYSGRRRVPASISASYGQQRRRRRRSRGKLMVTPVHRFQPIESVAGSHHGRRSHQPLQQHHYYPAPYAPALTPRHSVAHAVELDTSVYLDLPLNNQGDAANDENVSKLKCGMWASFALATVIVASAKFYFDHQGSGVEVLVFCALLTAFFLSGLIVALCRVKVTRDLLATASAATSQPPTASASHELEAVITSLSPAAPPPPPPQPAELPPPPYHIAIMLPLQPPSEAEESPPPSYDKVIR